MHVLSLSDSKPGFFKRILEKWKLFRFNRMIRNNWPVYHRLGPRFEFVSEDLLRLKVRFPFNNKTKGYNGFHFGGAIYAFVDPLYVYSISESLGPEYLVLDTKAEIDFLKASNQDLIAETKVSHEEIRSIREECGAKKKTSRIYQIEVLDPDGQKVAIVKKTIYIRKLNPSFPITSRL
ncbi:PaaI family thioesterase [Leptospira licerasiae]|uniref:PaaI family thioesterase n=1 Tax=Leptospira licerasiae TaxID=447106 RepID=UPI00301A6505